MIGVWQRVARRLRSMLPERPSIRNAAGDRAQSISGEGAAYLEVCRRAAVGGAAFDSFRRHPDYTPVLEHVSEEQGRQYFDLLSLNGRARARIHAVAERDDVGGPMLMRPAPGLTISPATLRYLKVADDLERMFGSLDGASVVEIGVGYGGQCRVLDLLFELESFTLVDLRPVLSLAEQFLGHCALRTKVSFLTMNELGPEPRDLALSNYAFTELSRSLQETYYRKVLAPARRGYITYNDIAPPEYRSMTADELCQRLAAITVPEQPLTHPRNRILVWGLPG